MTDLLLLVLFVALVGVAGFLSLAEVALLRVQPVTLAAEADPGDRRTQRVLQLIDELTVVVNTVLLVVLFVQVTAAAVSGYLAQRLVGGIGVTIVTFVVTIVLFIYAEVIPKTMALRSPLRWARLVATPVGVMVRVLRPVTAALIAVADAHIPDSDGEARSAFTEEELRRLAAESAAAGEIEPDDAELVERSFDFGDRRVRDVYVPRAEVVSADVAMSVEESLELAVEHGHRRLPVCDGDLDRVVGVVRLRDLAAAVREASSSTVAELAQEPLRVAPDDLVAAVLRRMQATGHRFGVVGGPGGVEGVVTVEDIVAELVGEIEEDD